MDTMYIIDYLLRRHNPLTSKYAYEIYFLQVAIDVVRDVSAFGGDQELIPFIVILIDEVVEGGVDDFL
jgi:hypothetical protein